MCRADLKNELAFRAETFSEADAREELALLNEGLAICEFQSLAGKPCF